MRIYAIGDVHGRLDLLEKMHARIEAEIAADSPGDWRVIHLGDYCDRGPDSRGVIDRLIGAKAADSRVLTLAGNHDVGFLAHLDEPDAHSLFALYGGLQTAMSYGVMLDPLETEELVRLHAAFEAAVPKPHRTFLESLEVSASFGDYFFCHAGIRPGVPLEEQSPDDLIWIRRGFIDHEGLHPKVIVHGHTIARQPELMANRVNVDTGAYHSGVLTAFVIEGAAKRIIAVGE